MKNGDIMFYRNVESSNYGLTNMNEDLDRIIKGYKPRSNKGSYWALYYLFEMIAIMRIKFFSMFKS